MNVFAVLVYVLFGAAVLGFFGVWLWDRRRRQAFGAEMAQRWRELHAAAEQQREDHIHLLATHRQERESWQAECAGLHARLADQATAWETHRQASTESFECERAQWLAERTAHLARADDFDQRATTARHQRQAAISLLRRVLNQRTLARGMPVEDTAEAFAFLVRTPDDELPQVHEQCFDKQTLRLLPHR